MEDASFLVNYRQTQPAERSFRSDDEAIKQHPVNSSHFSPYKNYLKQGAFSKKETVHKPADDPLLRAKELLEGMNYALGRVQRIDRGRGVERVGRIAPGPCQPDIDGRKVPLPPAESPEYDDELTTSLEKGFEKVRLQPISHPSKPLLTRSPASSALRHGSVPQLTSVEKEQLNRSFQTRVASMRSQLKKRVERLMFKGRQQKIFTQAVNDLRANTSLNFALQRHVETRLTPEFRIIKGKMLSERAKQTPPKKQSRDILKELERELIFLQSDREKREGRARQLKLGSEYITWLKESAPKKYSPDPSYNDMPIFTLRLKPVQRQESLDADMKRKKK